MELAAAAAAAGQVRLASPFARPLGDDGGQDVFVFDGIYSNSLSSRTFTCGCLHDGDFVVVTYVVLGPSGATPYCWTVHGPMPGSVCRPHPGRYRAGGYAASVRQHERPRAVDKFGRARHRT